MYWVLALQIGPLSPGADDTTVKAGLQLRNIVKKALDIKTDLSEDLLVTIGPKLSIMLAFGNEFSAERVLGLAEAVQSVLESSERSGHRWPVAGVMTRGEMRRVNVLGCGWNFEGRPAIAAARILAKLEAGSFAVEERAWTPGLRDDLEGPMTIPGKHEEEEYTVWLHSRIRFPSVVRSRAPRGTQQMPVLTPRASAIGAAEVTACLGACLWQRLDIEAFPVSRCAPCLIHERHEILIREPVDKLIVPLTLAVPREQIPAEEPCLKGDPEVFSTFGWVKASVAPPAALNGALAVLVCLPPTDDRQPLSLDVVYRCDAPNGRLLVRLPCVEAHRIERARVVVWGNRGRLRRGVKAFSIGTAGSHRGRHPILGECLELGVSSDRDSEAYAQVFQIDRFDLGFDHEVSWPGTWDELAFSPIT